MATRATENDWPELIGQWQAAGQLWADWWKKSGVLLPSLAALPLETGNAALALPIPATVWIDPVAAGELTERYNRRFEALWRRAATGIPESHAEHGPPGAAHDRRFLASEWREARRVLEPFVIRFPDSVEGWSLKVSGASSTPTSTRSTWKIMRPPISVDSMKRWGMRIPPTSR